MIIIVVFTLRRCCWTTLEYFFLLLLLLLRVKCYELKCRTTTYRGGRWGAGKGGGFGVLSLSI